MVLRLAVLVSVGVLLVVAGFSTDLVTSESTVWVKQSHSDSRVLGPLSESLVEFVVGWPYSILHVSATSNDTLLIEVLRGGKAEFRWVDQEFQKNAMLYFTGEFTVRVRNESEEGSCNYTIMLVLEERKITEEKPYLWLYLPLLSGGLYTLLLVPFNIFSDYGDRVNREMVVNLTAITTILGLERHFIDKGVTIINFLHRFKGWLNIGVLENALSITVILLLIFSYQIAGFALQTSNPWVVNRGVSMEPTIYNGDLTIIVGAEPQDIVEEEIILYNKIAFDFDDEDFPPISSPVLHRVTYVTKEGDHIFFKTKGDNSEKPDEYYVPDEGVIGKAVIIMPKLGLIVIILERFEVKMLIIGVILFAFIIYPSIRPKRR